MLKCYNLQHYENTLLSAWRTNLNRDFNILKKKILICELFAWNVAYKLYWLFRKWQNFCLISFSRTMLKFHNFYILFAQYICLVSTFFRNVLSPWLMKVLPPYQCKDCLSNTKTDQKNSQKQMNFAKILKCHNLQHYLGRDRLSQMVTVNVGIVYHLALQLHGAVKTPTRRTCAEIYASKWDLLSRFYIWLDVSALYLPFIIMP